MQWRNSQELCKLYFWGGSVPDGKHKHRGRFVKAIVRIRCALMPALLMSALLFPTVNAGAQQTVNQAGAGASDKTPRAAPQQDLDTGNILRLLNDAVKTYGQALSDLDEDMGSEPASLPTQSAASLDQMLRQLTESDEFDAVLKAAAQAAPLARPLGTAQACVIGIAAGIVSAILTLAGDRLLRRHRPRQRAED